MLAAAIVLAIALTALLLLTRMSEGSAVKRAWGEPPIVSGAWLFTVPKPLDLDELEHADEPQHDVLDRLEGWKSPMHYAGPSFYEVRSAAARVSETAIRLQERCGASRGERMVALVYATPREHAEAFRNPKAFQECIRSKKWVSLAFVEPTTDPQSEPAGALPWWSVALLAVCAVALCVLAWSLLGV